MPPWVTRIDRTLWRAIYLQGAEIMAALDDLKRTLSEINATTTEIGEDVAALVSGLEGGATAEQIAEVQAQATAIATKLTAVAAQYPPVPPV